MGNPEPLLESSRERTLTQELVVRYLAGDHEAETRLFDAERAFLLTYAQHHRLMRVLSRRLTPEDVVSETFLRALASGFFSDFENRGPGSLRGGLVTILDCVMVDSIRRFTAKKRVPDANNQSLDQMTEDRQAKATILPGGSTIPSPTSEARASELLLLCKRALTAREWSAWLLSEGEGLDSIQIGREMATTAPAVRGLIGRARMKIRDMLCPRPSSESRGSET